MLYYGTIALKFPKIAHNLKNGKKGKKMEIIM